MTAKESFDAIKRQYDGAVAFYRRTNGEYVCYYEDAEYMATLTRKECDTECGRKVFNIPQARLAGYEDAVRLNGRRVVII